MRRRTHRATPPQLSILGVDPSVTSTGFCYVEEGQAVVGTLRSKFKGMARMEHQLNQFRNLLDAAQPDFVMYEGYALQAKGQGRWSTAEMGGQFKLELYIRGIPVILVPPTTLKLAFTGKGNAKKPQMKAQAIEMFGIDGLLTDDEVDAYALHSLGQAMFYGTGPAAYLKRAEAAKSKVELHRGKGPGKEQTFALLASVG